MSVIIRLQNLAWSANANDIREFFKGLTIPEGGVHIVGGEMGDAFIAFSTDEDARLAMMKSGESLKSVQITLQLSSRTQMQKVIETARQQALGLQSYVPPPPPQPVTTVAASQQQQQQPPFQQLASVSHMANNPNQMMSPQSSGASMPSHLPNDQNLNQSELSQQASMYPNQQLPPGTFNQNYANQMGQYGANSFSLSSQMQPQGPFPHDQQQYGQSKMPLGMGQQPPMNQMTNQFYPQMYQNQMGRSMPSHLQGQDMSQSQSPVQQTVSSTGAAAASSNSNNASLSSASTPPTGSATESEDKKDKPPQKQQQQQQPQQQVNYSKDKRDRDVKDDRRRRSKSNSRSKSRERDRRRRHRSRSRSRSRDRSSRRRKSRSRERERPRDRDRDKERDRRERDSRSRTHRDRTERATQEEVEPKISKQDNSGGIPGLGEIPEDIPREGLSIFTSVNNESPQVSQNDAGWPTKDKKEVSIPKPQFSQKDSEMKEAPLTHHTGGQSSVPDKGSTSTQQFAHVTNAQDIRNTPPLKFNMNKDTNLPNQINEAVSQQLSGRELPSKEGKRPRLDNQEIPPMERKEWDDNRSGTARENQDSKPLYNESWPNQRDPERRSRFDSHEPTEEFTTGPPGGTNRDFGPPGPDYDQWSGSGRDSHQIQGSSNTGRTWLSDRGGCSERGNFEFKRNFRGRFNFEGPGGKREPEMEHSGMSPDGSFNQKQSMEFGRGGIRGQSYEQGRPWIRGGSSRGRMGRFMGSDGREHKQKTCSIEVLNLHNSTGYKAIKEAFSGIHIAHGTIKILTDDQGNRINVALIQFKSPFEAFEALKRNGTNINGSQVEINFIDDTTYDSALDQVESRGDFGNRNYPPLEGRQESSNNASPCMYLSGLPSGSTECDVTNFLNELSINYKEVCIEYDSVLRKATGSCFVRLISPEETRFALRRVPSLPLNGQELRIEICPEEAMNEYNRHRSFPRENSRQEGPFGRASNDRREEPFNPPNGERCWPPYRPMNDKRDLPNLMSDSPLEPFIQSTNERPEPPFRRNNERNESSNRPNERNEPPVRFNDGRRNDERRWPPNNERRGPSNYTNDDRPRPSNSERRRPGEHFPSNDGSHGLPSLMNNESFDQPPRSFDRREEPDFPNNDRKAQPPNRLDDQKQGKSITQNSSTSEPSAIYISDLPFGSTEQDIERLLNDKSISASQVVLELEKGSRQPTGGFFIRIGSVDAAKKASRTLKGANLEGRHVKVELCSEELIDKAIANKEKLKIFTKKPEVKSSPQVKEPSKIKDHKPSLDKAPPNETPKRDQQTQLKDGTKAEQNGQTQNKDLNQASTSTNITNDQDKPYDTNLLTDSVVLKNVSKTVSPSSIRNFFSDDGLIPEIIHFNQRNSHGECDVFVVFPLIEDAKKVINKSGLHLGPNQVEIKLISKPTVMAAMGKEFNPHELFKKQLPLQTEKVEPPKSETKTLLPSPRKESSDGRDDDSLDLVNDSNTRDSRNLPRTRDSGPRRSDFSTRGGRPPVQQRPQSQIGTLVTPDSFGKPGCVVALGNVPFAATIDDILLFLRDFPSLSPECIIRRYDEKNRPTSDARVAFQSPQEAIRALETLNGRFLMDRRIKLSPID